jgi:hypothetical protein
VDDDLPVKEFNFPGIGYKGIPILKGRISELANVSEEDKREQEVEEILKEGF